MPCTSSWNNSDRCFLNKRSISSRLRVKALSFILTRENYWLMHKAAFSFFPFLEQGTRLALGIQTWQDAFLTSTSSLVVGVSTDIKQHETFSRKQIPTWRGFTAKEGKVFKGKTTQHAAPEAKLNFHFRYEHSVITECSSISYGKLFFLSCISVL